MIKEVDKHELKNNNNKLPWNIPRQSRQIPIILFRYSVSNATLYNLFFILSLSFWFEAICKANFFSTDQLCEAYSVLALHWPSLKMTSKCQCS